MTGAPQRVRLRDLGPLDQALLQAFVLADAEGLCLTAPMARRALPGFRTDLANVRAALLDGQPLRTLLAEAGGFFVLRDRAERLRELPARQHRAGSWIERYGKALVGLGKLPWVEGVAIQGPTAWGQWPIHGAPRLAVLTEGGRAALAQRAVQAFLQLRFLKAARPEAFFIDVDDVEPEARGLGATFARASLLPITFGDAFAARWAAGPDAAHFPQGGPGIQHGLALAPSQPRVDGRLAAWRRALVAPGVETAVGQRSRRPTVIDRLEEPLTNGSVGTWPEAPESSFSTRLAGWFDEGGPKKKGAGRSAGGAPSAPADNTPQAAAEPATDIGGGAPPSGTTVGAMTRGHVEVPGLPAPGASAEATTIAASPAAGGAVEKLAIGGPRRLGVVGAVPPRSPTAAMVERRQNASRVRRRRATILRRS